MSIELKKYFASLIPGLEFSDDNRASYSSTYPKVLTVIKPCLVASIQAANENIACPISQLPKDALLHIFSFLDNKALARIIRVCKACHRIGLDPLLWLSRFKKLFPTVHLKSNACISVCAAEKLMMQIKGKANSCANMSSKVRREMNYYNNGILSKEDSDLISSTSDLFKTINQETKNQVECEFLTNKVVVNIRVCR